MCFSANVRYALLAFTTLSWLALDALTSLAQPIDISRLRDRIKSSSNGGELQLLFRESFSDEADPDFVRKCLADSDDTLSCRAAWQAVKDSVPAKKPSRPADLRAPNALAIERFLGFVDGRLRVQMPSWWEDSLRSARLRGEATWIARDVPAGATNSVPLPDELVGTKRLLEITRFCNRSRPGEQ
jgi:hypothetical protein